MEKLPKETLRIIDANVNRIGEGLRVVEDVGRDLELAFRALHNRGRAGLRTYALG
jgi:hypothetical protein